MKLNLNPGLIRQEFKSDELHLIKLKDGGVIEYVPYWLRSIPSKRKEYKNIADSLYEDLLNETPWKQGNMKIYGHEYLTPRMIAWYGDPNAAYKFSGVHLDPEPWSKPLMYLKERLDKYLLYMHHFNSVLLNYYRDGDDSIGWHRDDEKSLGKNPVIASISLGGRRKFQLRNYKDNEQRIEFELEHGSLLLMRGTLQHNWQHQIPKQANVEPRINLTFREIKEK